MATDEEIGPSAARGTVRSADPGGTVFEAGLADSSSNDVDKSSGLGDSGLPDDGLNDTSIASLAGQWLSLARDRVSVSVDLVIAEAKLAALSVVLMVMLAVIAALSIFTVWATAIAALVVVMQAKGVALWLALFGVALVHVLITVAMFTAIAKLSSRLEFRASRRKNKSTEVSTEVNE